MEVILFRGGYYDFSCFSTDDDNECPAVYTIGRCKYKSDKMAAGNKKEKEDIEMGDVRFSFCHCNWHGVWILLRTT